MEVIYYVYAFRSIKIGHLYKGFTNDLDRRLNEHYSGKMSATNHMLPVELVHVEITLTRNKARELEIYFKSGYGKEILKEIAENK